MHKYTDEDIRNMSKITCKIAADYLGIRVCVQSADKSSLAIKT